MYMLPCVLAFQGIKAIFPGGTCGFSKDGGCIMIYPLTNILPKCTCSNSCQLYLNENKGQRPRSHIDFAWLPSEDL